MEISALATQAVTLIPPAIKFLKDSGMGEALKNSSMEYWELVKRLFIESPSAQNTLGQLESDPDNPRLQAKAEATLEMALEQNPDLVAKLQEAIQKFEEAQAKAGSNTLSVQGNLNRTVQGVSGNNNQINQGTQQHHTGSGDNVGGNKITNQR
jgi:hypothetical protein